MVCGAEATLASGATVKLSEFGFIVSTDSTVVGEGKASAEDLLASVVGFELFLPYPAIVSCACLLHFPSV